MKGELLNGTDTPQIRKLPESQLQSTADAKSARHDAKRRSGKRRLLYTESNRQSAGPATDPTTEKGPAAPKAGDDPAAQTAPETAVCGGIFADCGHCVFPDSIPQRLVLYPHGCGTGRSGHRCGPLNPLSAGCHRLLSIVTKMLTYGSNKYSCTSSEAGEGDSQL